MINYKIHFISVAESHRGLFWAQLGIVAHKSQDKINWHLRALSLTCCVTLSFPSTMHFRRNKINSGLYYNMLFLLSLWIFNCLVLFIVLCIPLRPLFTPMPPPKDGSSTDCAHSFIYFCFAFFIHFVFFIWQRAASVSRPKQTLLWVFGS